MVFVQSRELRMGNNDGQFDEKPEHLVLFQPFCIDRFEVTWSEYESCVEAGVCSPSPLSADPRFAGPDKPATGVTWGDALACCRRRSVRLPTELEWEAAARGPESWRYPWGDSPEEGRSNCAEGCGDFYPFTAPVGTFDEGMSSYGLHDMAGNAAEWVADEYCEDPHRGRGYALSADGNCLRGIMAVVRGGSYKDPIEVTRSSNRYYNRLEEGDPTIGFRCASDLKQAEP
jgi:formylglycine-generating enzyme required for sulfatase activity